MRKALTKTLVSFLILVLMITTAALTVKAEDGALPTLTAKAACSMSSATGNVIFEKNKDTKLVPASTTKLLTALIVAENADMDQVVTMDKEVADTEESEIYLHEGEQISVKDLFYAMLVHSANDASVALAKVVAGTTDKFVDLMNQKAKEIGAENSHFTNPAGLKEDDHYSTAYDLTLIGKEAFHNDLVRKAAGTKKYEIAQTNKWYPRVFENTNLLIQDDEKIEINGEDVNSKYEGVFAGKTGTWNDEESSLVIGLDDQGVEIIATIMDSTGKERYGDMVKLLDYSKEHAPRYKVFEKGEDFGMAFIVHGESCFIDSIARDDGLIDYPEGVSEDLISTETEFYDNEAPIKTGQKLGKVHIKVDDDVIASVDLVSSEDVEEGWFPSYIGISNVMTIVLLCILVAIAIVILIIMRKKKKIKRRLERERQRRLERYVLEKRLKEEDRSKRNWDV